MSVCLQTPRWTFTAEAVLFDSRGNIHLLDENGEDLPTPANLTNHLQSLFDYPEARLKEIFLYTGSTAGETLSLLIDDKLVDSSEHRLTFSQHFSGIGIFRFSGPLLALLNSDGWETKLGKPIAEVIVGPRHFFGHQGQRPTGAIAVGPRARLSELAERVYV